MLPSVFPRLATDSAGRVSWCLKTSLLKIPFPGRASLPGTELPPHLLCLLFIFNLDILSLVLYRWRSLEATVKIKLKTRSRKLKSKA